MTYNSIWPSTPLGDLTINYDSKRIPVKESDRKSGPFPYYGASGIVDSIDDYIFDGDYLLIAEDGENLRTRKTSIAFMASGRFWVNNHAHIVKANANADTRYLMYALQMADVGGYLTGSTMPKLTQQSLNRIPITSPPLSVQRRIAHILGTLDDKIELNRQMNQTLDELARTIFRSWFVDFDPVRAKAEGREPDGMDAETAALFPDRFVDSALGPIPEGWDRSTLGDELETLETGSRPKGGVKGIQSGIPSIGAESVVGIGHFDYGKTKYVPSAFFEGMKRGRIEDRDVLLYKDGGKPGSFEPHVTIVGDGFPFTIASINEHVYRLRSAERLSQSFLYYWLSSDSATHEMRQKGTGVAIPGLNSSSVRSISALVPTKDVITAFGRAIDPVITRIFASCNESRTLAELRDTLLPELLSGRLRPAS